MFLSHIFISIAFSKKDKMEKYISKAFIINASLQFLYIRAITIILLELLCVRDILMVVVVYMFLSSIYISYCYQLQTKYQKEENILSYIFYYLNLIYFWDAICLFIGKIISNTKFTGILNIFFIGVFLIIIFALTFPKKRMTSFNIFIGNEIDVYNQIRLMIDAIDDRSIKREKLFDIFAYLSEKLQRENLENDELILKRKIESFKNFSHINDKEFEYYLLQQVDLLLKESINYFRDSILLQVTYAIFQIEKLGRYNKGYINLTKVTETPHLSFSQGFLIYRIKRRLEEKGIEDGIDKSNLSFRYQCNQLISMISRISIIYTYFWNLLLSSSDYEDIIQLSEYGSEINEMMDKIEDKFKSLQNSNYNNKRTIKLYGMYVRDILNEQEKALSYLNIDQNENFKKNFDINTITPNSDLQYMIISGKEENFGIINKISLGFCHLLGYNDEELIGQNLAFLLPDCINKVHNEMLMKKTIVFKIGENSNINLKNHFVLLKTSSKCFVPINLAVGILLDEDYNSLIFCKINYDAEQYNFFSPGVYFFLTNHKLIIESFTSNCLDNLGLSNQIINNNKEITPFIKEFHEDVLSKLINAKYSEKLKIKLKVLRHKYLKENPITWKNNKKYLMLVEEITINKDSCGFIFRIDNYDLRESQISSTQRLSGIGQGRRNSITTIKEIEKRKDFPQIGKNYIPSNYDEINFDINDKIFLFQDKTLKGDIIENIGDYFNDKYYQPEIKIVKENEEEEKEENEENEDDESESSEYEEEEKKENSKIEKSLFSEDNINDYYKVNINNIKYSVYNYIQNIDVEINNFNKESKVEQIIKGEIEKDKSQNINHTKSISFKVGNNIKKNEENDKKINSNERNYEIIHKMISPKTINDSILIFILLYSLILIFILIITILFFLNIYSSRNNILKVHTDIAYLINIYRDILNTNFYVVEMMLILNDKYTNLYQDKNEYFERCKSIVLDLFDSSIQQIEYFCYSKVKVSNETKFAVDNYKINIKNYQTTVEGLKYTSLFMKFTDALNEYDYTLYDYCNSDKNTLNPQNVNLFFVVFNVEKLIKGIEFVFDKYYLEINEQIHDEHILIYIYLFIFIFLEMIASYLGFKASKKLILEKERYLKYFYKIGDEPIKNILSRCEKFIKLNRETPTTMISEPEINLESENENSSSENSSLIIHEEDKIIIKKKKKNLKNSNNNELINFSELRLNIFLTIFFYLMELILCVYISMYVIHFISKIPYFETVEYLTVKYERLPTVILNYLRMYLLFYPVMLNDEQLTHHENIFKNDIINAYFNISRTFTRLYGNISKYDLSNEVKVKYKYIEINSLCDYFSGFLTNYSILCEDFSNNITTQGLALIYSYCMNSVYYLYNKIITKISNSINNGYSYNELYYGTSNYSVIGPDEENPFYIFNDDVFKNYTVIVIYLVNPVISDLINSVDISLNNLFSTLENNIVMINIVTFILLTFFYICYIIPFTIQKNLLLNKTRKMLGIIPKDIFLDILNHEKMGEKD